MAFSVGQPHDLKPKFKSFRKIFSRNKYTNENNNKKQQRKTQTGWVEAIYLLLLFFFSRRLVYMLL